MKCLVCQLRYPSRACIANGENPLFNPKSQTHIDRFHQALDIYRSSFTDLASNRRKVCAGCWSFAFIYMLAGSVTDNRFVAPFRHCYHHYHSGASSSLVGYIMTTQCSRVTVFNFPISYTLKKESVCSTRRTSSNVHCERA